MSPDVLAAHEARWGKRSWKHKQMIAKRFTQAELAAEVLMHERDHWRDMAHGGIRQWRYDRLLKIRDIASRPHYDEVL